MAMRHRTKRITNSLGAKASFKLYQSMRDPKYICTEEEYYKIIREHNVLLVEKLFEDQILYLPKLGYINFRLKYYKPTLTEDGKLINLPYINFKETYKLWAEDPQSKEDKVYIRYNITQGAVIKYNSRRARIKGMGSIVYDPSRAIRKELRRRESEGMQIYHT